MKSMQQMMDDLKHLEGEEYDRAFLDTMIIHHQQAVDMTEEAMAKAVNPDLRELAEEMHQKQHDEIEQMEEMLHEEESVL